MSKITYADIQKMCEEFLNDKNTISALENNWINNMTTQKELQCSQYDIMRALNISIPEEIVEIPVIWTYKGEKQERTMYVATYNNVIEISMHERLLYDD